MVEQKKKLKSKFKMDRKGDTIHPLSSFSKNNKRSLLDTLHASDPDVAPSDWLNPPINKCVGHVHLTYCFLGILKEDFRFSVRTSGMQPEPLLFTKAVNSLQSRRATDRMRALKHDTHLINS